MQNQYLKIFFSQKKTTLKLKKKASEITMTNSSDDFVGKNKTVDPDLIFEKGLLVYGI